MPPAATLEPSRVFFLEGPLSAADVQDIADRLLCDAVSERCVIRGSGDPARGPDQPVIEVLPRPGVMDPAALSTEQAIRELGYPIDRVRTGRRYRAYGIHDDRQLRLLAERQLANSGIEQIHIADAQRGELLNPFIETRPNPQTLREIELLHADDATLAAIARDGHLFLSLAEMQAIQSHFRARGRSPTDVELETLAQTWSEHCVHKTLKSAIRYQGSGFPEHISLRPDAAAALPTIERVYPNLLRETIVRATRSLDPSWCLSVFHDNAGIIAFDDRHGVAFKVETHNHPSALEPYGGAATGIGGCIRDILGVGLGARPIANTTVFCFADPRLPAERVPRGVIHPARSMREVVRGVRDYGNRMGIPTVNGAVVFDERYLGNPLVYCGCVGLIPRDRIAKQVCDGDRIVLIGGRTGRDGIHGATFSSGEMTDTHAGEFAHAVQIGNAIVEKKVADVLLQARDAAAGCLYHALTDCGAGGLSSAVGEMGATLGAIVELQRVPLKYDGLRYDEIWISEAQERMVLAVPPDRVDAVLRLCAAEDVEATDIGRFGGGHLVLQYGGREVGRLELAFLHGGMPSRQRSATWQPAAATPATAAAAGPAPRLYDQLLAELSSPNVASKEWIIRQYDHEVQGGSVIKPLMGPGSGPSDGAVVKPLLGSPRAIALSCGVCPQLSDQDPYVMAVAAVDEAVRNNICVGGNLEQLALLDNFCWGDVSDETQLGGLLRAAQGCHDAAVAYGTPFISGKDSLNNVFRMQASEAQRLGWPERIQIPGTVLISAISVIDDVATCRSSDLKAAGHAVVWVRPLGARLADLAAGSRTVSHWLKSRPGICSAHDVSEGGLLVCAAEMVIGSDVGLCLDGIDPGTAWFEPQLGNYLLEVEPALLDALQSESLQATRVGTVIPAARLELRVERRRAVGWSAAELAAAWRATFDWA